MTLEYVHMNPISGMKSTILSCSIAAIFLGVASLASADNNAVVQNAGNVTYVSGGVGLESLDQLSSMSRDFNLKLVFALNSGAYLSGVQVAIVDNKGKTVLDTTSDGPWFMAKLPAGNYQVMATVAGKTDKRQVTVGTSQLKTVDLRWASE
jgi:uncharacterized protein YigE (DUF2233 family)